MLLSLRSIPINETPINPVTQQINILLVYREFRPIYIPFGGYKVLLKNRLTSPTSDNLFLFTR